MHLQSVLTKFHLQIIWSSIFNLGLITGLTVLAFGLVSCSGSNSSSTAGNTGSTAPTITSITPSGIVASSSPQSLSISGTNFTSGMNLSIANSSGVITGYTITASSVKSSTVLAASAVIAAAPIDNYVKVIVKASTSATTSSTAVWGVAGTSKTFASDILPILSAPPSGMASCTGCHTGIANGGLDLNSANNLNVEPSKGCPSKLRVVPGDPRRSSSVLIDKIKATSAVPACFGLPMPNNATLLSPAEIQDIVDWVAGGAN